MIWLAIGSSAFIFFALSDYGKLRYPERAWNLLFLFGCIVLFFSTIVIVPWKEIFHRFLVSPLGMTILGLLAVLSLVVLIYTLFFALPFRITYTENSTKKHILIDKGVYSLCRHPGVLFFSLFYFFFMFIAQSTAMYFAFFIFTTLDILYVIWQDIYLFPKTIADYDLYKKVTPFLIPNKSSFYQSIKSSDTEHRF